MPTRVEWAKLSKAPQKRDVFEKDLYFRECWADIADIFGSSAVSIVSTLAILSFKPDGVVARRMKPTLDFVMENGFLPVGMAPIQFNRHSMRELWRYNWDIYTTDRLAMSTLLYTAADTLVLMLRDSHYDGVIPASVRLSNLKGPAEPKKRREGQLRTVLRPPNSVINFVHVADEPADIVREMGILLDRAERRELLTNVVKNLHTATHASVLEEIAKLESRHDEHDFDLERSLSRLELSAVANDAIVRLRAVVENGRRLRWDELRSLIDPADPSVNVWDFICVAAAVLPLERKGFSDLLPSASAKEWSN